MALHHFTVVLGRSEIVSSIRDFPCSLFSGLVFTCYTTSLCAFMTMNGSMNCILHDIRDMPSGQHASSFTQWKISVTIHLKFVVTHYQSILKRILHPKMKLTQSHVSPNKTEAVILVLILVPVIKSSVVIHLLRFQVCLVQYHHFHHVLWCYFTQLTGKIDYFKCIKPLGVFFFLKMSNL